MCLGGAPELIHGDQMTRLGLRVNRSAAKPDAST